MRYSLEELGLELDDDTGGSGRCFKGGGSGRSVRFDEDPRCETDGMDDAVESFVEAMGEDEDAWMDQENDVPPITPNVKSRVPTHVVNVQTPATLPPPKSWARSGGRLQRSSPPTTPASASRKRANAAPQHSTPAKQQDSTERAAPMPPAAAPTAPALTQSLAAAYVTDLLGGQDPHGEDDDATAPPSHRPPPVAVRQRPASPDYEALYTALEPTLSDVPSGMATPEVFASPQASPRGSAGGVDQPPGPPVTAANAWLHCLAYEACVQLCMDAAGENNDADAQMHALGFLTRGCAPLRDSFGLHHVLLRPSSAGAPVASAAHPGGSASSKLSGSEGVTLEVVRVKQSRPPTESADDARGNIDPRASLTLRASAAMEHIARGLQMAKKVSGKIINKVRRPVFRVHLRLTSWSEDRMLRLDAGSGATAELPLGALAASDAGGRGMHGSGALAAALAVENLEMLVYAGVAGPAASCVARGGMPLRNLVAGSGANGEGAEADGTLRVALTSMADGTPWGHANLRASTTSESARRAHGTPASMELVGAPAGVAISHDAAYDVLLESALRSSRFSHGKLSMDPNWRWLVTTFGIRHGIAAPSRSLRYVRHVVLQAQSPSGPCLSAISENIAAALQAEQAGTLPAPDARLLGALKGPLGSLLALCFEAYKELGTQDGANGATRPSDPGSIGHTMVGEAAARPPRRGSAPGMCADMSLAALGNGPVAYPTAPGARGLPMVPVLHEAVRLHDLLYDPLDPNVQATLNSQLATAARRRFTRASTESEQASLATACATVAAERRYREIVLLCRALRAELALDGAIHETNCLPSCADLPRIAAREYAVMMRASIARLLKDHPPEKPERSVVDVMHAAGDLQRDCATCLAADPGGAGVTSARGTVHSLLAPSMLGDAGAAPAASESAFAATMAMESCPLDTAALFQPHVNHWVEDAKTRLVADAAELDESQAIAEVFGASEAAFAAATATAGKPACEDELSSAACGTGCGTAPATPGLAPTHAPSEQRDAMAPARRVRGLEEAGRVLLDAHDPLALRWPDRHAPLVEDALCTGVLACLSALERQRKLASRFVGNESTGGVARVSLYSRVAHVAAHSRVARRITGGSSLAFGHADAQTADLDAGAALHLNSLLALIQLVPAWHSRVKSWSGQPPPEKIAATSGVAMPSSAPDGCDVAPAFHAPALSNICSSGSGEGFVHVASECRQHFTTAVRRVVERLHARLSLPKRSGLRHIMHAPFVQNEEFARSLQPMARAIAETRDVLASRLDRRAAAAVLRGLWDMNARELVNFLERTASGSSSGTTGLAWGVSRDGPVAAVKSVVRQVVARGAPNGAAAFGGAGVVWLRRRRAQEALAMLERVFRSAIHETLGHAAREADARPPHHAWKAAQVLQHAASAEAALIAGAYAGGGSAGVSAVPGTADASQLGFDVY